MWMLPVVFPMVMAFGGFLGLVGVAASRRRGRHRALGAAARPRGGGRGAAALVVAAALVGVFAIFHGHAHGTELPAGESGLLYSVGFVVATGCLHAAGIVLGLVHRWRWGRVVIRAAGIGVACGGAVFLRRALG